LNILSSRGLEDKVGMPCRRWWTYDERKESVSEPERDEGSEQVVNVSLSSCRKVVTIERYVFTVSVISSGRRKETRSGEG